MEDKVKNDQAARAPETADEYIRARLLAGARDPDMIAKELTSPKLLGMKVADQLAMLETIVRPYVHNRVRGWQRAIENMAGRQGIEEQPDEEGDAPQGRARGPESMGPLEARKAHLNEFIYVPGRGQVWNRDATKPDFQAAIMHLQSIITGSEKSISFYRRCIAAMDKHHVKTFGEVPLEYQI